MKQVVIFGLMVGALVSGCYEAGSVEAYRASAVSDCLRRSLEVQGYKFAEAGQPDGEGEELLSRVLSQRAVESVFRFDSTAQFVIDFGSVALGQPHAAYNLYNLKCTGDFNRKILTSMQINERMYQPKAGESWVFLDDDESDSVSSNSE